MPSKTVKNAKYPPLTPSADPIAKAGEYKSIAAQYAKAKALKESEDTAAGKKAGGVGEKNGQAKRKGIANTLLRP